MTFPVMSKAQSIKNEILTNKQIIKYENNKQVTKEQNQMVR